MFVKIANECTAKEGATQADLDELIEHKRTVGKGAKCIKACLAETVGMVCVDNVQLEIHLTIVLILFIPDEEQSCGYRRNFECCVHGI